MKLRILFPFLFLLGFQVYNGNAASSADLQDAAAYELKQLSGAPELTNTDKVLASATTLVCMHTVADDNVKAKKIVRNKKGFPNKKSYSLKAPVKNIKAVEKAGITCQDWLSSYRIMRQPCILGALHDNYCYKLGVILI